MANELLVSVVIGAAIKGSFNTVFGRAEKTVGTLGKAIGRVTKHQTKLGSVINRSMQSSHRSINKNVRKYNQMGDAIKRAKKSQDSLSRSIANQKQAKAYRKQLRGDIVESAAPTAAMGFGLGKALKIFSRQEDAATDLKLVMMKASGGVGEFNNVLDKTLTLGRELPGTTTDFINLAKSLKSQGMSDKLLLNGGLENSARLNVVMNMQQAEGGEFFMKLAEAYGLKESELYQAADITQKGSAAFGLKKSDMYDTMKYSAPTVNALDLTGIGNYEKLMAVQGMGAQKGLEGSSFGTNFSQMLLRLAKGPKMLAKAKRGMRAESQSILNDLEITFSFFDKKGSFKGIEFMMVELEKLELVRKKSGEESALIIADSLFGAEAARPALIMAQAGRKGLEENIAKMREQAELNAKIAEKTKTFSAAMEQLGGAVEYASATFGSAFAEDIKSFANTVQQFTTNTLQPWLAKNKELVKWGFSLVAGMFAFRTALLVGKYALSTFLMPFRSLILGGKKVHAIFSLLSLARFGGLSKKTAKFRKIGKAFKFVTGGGLKLAVFFKGGFSKAIRVAGKAVLWLGRALLMNPIGLTVAAIAAGAYLIITNWGTVKNFFSDLWSSITFWADKAWNGIKNAWGNVTGWFDAKWQGVKIGASDAWNATKIFASDALLGVQNTWSNIGGWFNTKWDVIKQGAGNIWTDIQATWAGIKDKFTTSGSELMNGLKDGISSKTDAIKTKIMSVGSSVAGWFKGVLGIKSPSRVFMGFGNNISEGLAIGIDKKAKLALNASDSLAKSISRKPINLAQLDSVNGEIKHLNRGASSINTASTVDGIKITFAPNITVKGSAAKEDINQALKLSQHELEQMLNRLLDQRQRRSYT